MEITTKWFYGRVSRIEQQQDSNALKKQLERGKQYECTKFYWDIQSRTTEVRAGLQKLVDDLNASKPGEVTHLVVTRIDRIGSSSKLFYSLLTILRSKNIRLIALDQTIDTESIGGELTIDVLLAASKFEVKMLSNRVSAERKHRASQGKSHRFAPLGWKIIDDTYIKDESWCVSLIYEKRSFKVWELAAFVFEVFDECGSVKKTCNLLNRIFGIQPVIKPKTTATKNSHTFEADDLETIDFKEANRSGFKRYPWTGIQWGFTGVRNLLINPVYAGGTPYNLTKGNKKVPYDNWDCKWGTHQGIITREKHEQIKNTIKSNTNNRWASRETNINPYANLLKCSICGGSLNRTSSKVLKSGLHWYYQCKYYLLGRCTAKEMISIKSLDTQVIFLLTQKASELTETVTDDINKINPNELPEIINLRNNLAAINNIPYQSEHLDNTKLEITQRIEEVLRENKLGNAQNQLLKQDFINMFSDPLFWSNLSPDDKKRVLSNFILSIILTSGKVTRIDLLF
jgi:site-specific DNA recombinase